MYEIILCKQLLCMYIEWEAGFRGILVKACDKVLCIFLYSTTFTIDVEHCFLIGFGKIIYYSYFLESMLNILFQWLMPEGIWVNYFCGAWFFNVFVFISWRVPFCQKDKFSHIFHQRIDPKLGISDGHVYWINYLWLNVGNCV